MKKKNNIASQLGAAAPSTLEMGKFKAWTRTQKQKYQ